MQIKHRGLTIRGLGWSKVNSNRDRGPPGDLQLLRKRSTAKPSVEKPKSRRAELVWYNQQACIPQTATSQQRQQRRNALGLLLPFRSASLFLLQELSWQTLLFKDPS
ncbi:hypothetical protein JZ751_014859 [Albula glossodonta]|uniref:Uncharacterized protein n=1 Tax=Albula glossodonta TaxID=121402 RepID=A0A8T2MZX9_9TELE|nr:hypothetical protein JZ751_014859 [Albula glossodonta]